ncbi:MAG: hypothetical protein IPO76_07860 [Elusimicrobia bacterium]|nr:hypothetical protein [Elusimicrobiota bacterium]
MARDDEEIQKLRAQQKGFAEAKDSFARTEQKLREMGPGLERLEKFSKELLVENRQLGKRLDSEGKRLDSEILRLSELRDKYLALSQSDPDYLKKLEDIKREARTLGVQV